MFFVFIAVIKKDLNKCSACLKQNSYFGVDTFSELVFFFELLNNDDIKCKKSFTINYRRHL